MLETCPLAIFAQCGLLPKQLRDGPNHGDGTIVGNETIQAHGQMGIGRQPAPNAQ